MVYDPNIPTPTQFLSQSQSLIKENFSQLNNQFSVDHIALTAGADLGKHKKITFVQQGAAPTTGATEVALYTKSTVTTGEPTQPEIYARQISDGTEYLLTRGTPISSSGEGVLYGGLQIRSGTGGSNGGGFPNSFSTQFPTDCIAVVASGQNAAQPTNDIKITNISATGFTATSSQGEAIYYIAIGY